MARMNQFPSLALELDGNGSGSVYAPDYGKQSQSQVVDLGLSERADVEDFFENGAIALHSVGADGTILKANKAELELLGYTGALYIGRPIAEFHADKHVIDDILFRLARGEKLTKYPARLVAKDGSIKHVEITS